MMVVLTASPELLDTPFIVTLFELTLCVFPLAVALAVTEVPDESDSPTTFHVPNEDVVVDPSNVAPLYKSIVVPVASTEVPDIEVMVDAVQYVPVITGAKVTPPAVANTVKLFEAFDKQSVPEIAFAVMTKPDVNVKPDAVQLVPTAVIVVSTVVPAYNTMVAPDMDVPVTEVLLVVSEVVVITGAAVCVGDEPTHT